MFRINKAQKMLNDAFLRVHVTVSYRMYRCYCLMLIVHLVVHRLMLTVLMCLMMDLPFDYHLVALHFVATLHVHFETTPMPMAKNEEKKTEIEKERKSINLNSDISVIDSFFFYFLLSFTCNTRLERPVFCDNCFKSLASGF